MHDPQPHLSSAREHPQDQQQPISARPDPQLLTARAAPTDPQLPIAKKSTAALTNLVQSFGAGMKNLICFLEYCHILK